MKKQQLFFLLLCICVSLQMKPQAINCSSFCVTGITIDTTGANTLNVTISMGGTSSNFINYPYVSLVKNTLGDTVATGIMNFFGQGGNSSQVYTVSTSLDSLPANFTCTVYFKYDTVTCLLPYPCIPQGIAEKTALSGIKIYPNPSEGKFIFENEKPGPAVYELTIYNSLGNKIYSQAHSTQDKKNEIDLSAFPKGIYFIQLGSEGKIVRKKIVLH
jgi:hypothetical protein